MIDSMQYPKNYRAALDVLSGDSTPAEAVRRHGIDHGQLSRYLRWVRECYREKLEEARRDKEYWEAIAGILDNDITVD